jgi:methionyl aminopeptidase
MAREILDIGAAAIKPGTTCDEIDRIVHDATIERDAYPSPLNYHGFPKSVCTSVNEVCFASSARCGGLSKEEKARGS